MATHESSAPSGANQALNIELESTLQDLRTVSTLISQHADQGIESNWHKLSQESWWRHVDVLDWLSDRLKETVERAWRAYDSRMPANQKRQDEPEQPTGTLAELEAAFDANDRTWRAIGDDESEPWNRDEEDQIAECMARCISLMEQIAEAPINTLDDCTLKLRVALKRIHDGDRPPRIGHLAEDDAELAYRLLAQAREYLERFTAA